MGAVVMRGVATVHSHCRAGTRIWDGLQVRGRARHGRASRATFPPRILITRGQTLNESVVAGGQRIRQAFFRQVFTEGSINPLPWVKDTVAAVDIIENPLSRGFLNPV